MKKVTFSLLSALLLSSCLASSKKYEEKGQKVALSIAQDLSQVQTREDLLAIEATLKKKFLKIVKIAQHAQKVHLHENFEKNYLPSDQLKMELIRIYEEIDGGKEIIEKAQKEALHKLAIDFDE